MTLGKQTRWVGGLVLAVAATVGSANSQSVATGAPNQTVPDAPMPQTLPTLNTLTPIAPAGRQAAPAPTAQSSSATAASAAAKAEQQADEDADQGPPPASTASAANRLSVNVQFHEIPFTVKDSKGRLFAGITYRDVRVYENGLRQQIRLFTSDPFPLAVSLVIDQSVTQDTMEKINDSLSALQGSFTQYDEVAVFTYNNGVKKQTDFTAAQSARLGAVLDRSKGIGREPLMGVTGPLSHGSIINNEPIDGVNDPGHIAGSMQFTVPREYHTLNDAILAAAQEAATTGPERRRIVYVISDGKEYGSKATQKQVIKYLLSNNIAVWATIVGDSAIPGMGFLDRIHLPMTMRDDVLPIYTSRTGGQTDPEFRPRGIEESFARITKEARAQYTVGYYTHASPFDESFRRTEVRVMRPDLTIICKEGYFPSAADNVGRRPASTSTKP